MDIKSGGNSEGTLLTGVTGVEKKRRCGWWECEGVTDVGKRDGVRTDVGNTGVRDVECIGAVHMSGIWRRY